MKREVVEHNYIDGVSISLVKENGKYSIERKDGKYSYKKVFDSLESAEAYYQNLK